MEVWLDFKLCDHRGIDFDNFGRNFLLFIPATAPNLKAILSYYSSTATVNQEGDVHINDTLQGLGTFHSDLSFFAPQLCWKLLEIIPALNRHVLEGCQCQGGYWSQAIQFNSGLEQEATTLSLMTPQRASAPTFTC